MSCLSHPDSLSSQRELRCAAFALPMRQAALCPPNLSLHMNRLEQLLEPFHLRCSGQVLFKPECAHPIRISNNLLYIYCIVFSSSVFG